jgi:hypothetical protein
MLVLCLTVAPRALADDSYEAITLHNTTTRQITMNVDDHYACTANGLSDCDSDHEKLTAHHLTAIYQGEVVQSRDAPAKKEYTWTICEGDYPKTHEGRCPGESPPDP